MLPTAAVAFALAALAPAVRAQWVQFVAVPLCRNTTASQFSAAGLTFDILSPANFAGSPAACQLDSQNSTRSLYYQLTLDKSTVTLYECPSTNCTNCAAVLNVTNIANVATPDCGTFFSFLTSSSDPADGLPNVSVKYGGGAFATAYYSITNNCAHVTPTSWIKTTFDDANGIINTFTCTASDCQTGCTSALRAFKPSPPGQTTCHAGTTYDNKYTTATPLKSTSRYNKPSAIDFNPPSLGSKTLTDSASPTGKPVGDKSGLADSSSPSNTGLIIGIAAGALVLIGAVIAAVVLIRRKGSSDKSASAPMLPMQPQSHASSEYAESQVGGYRQSYQPPYQHPQQQPYHQQQQQQQQRQSYQQPSWQAGGPAPGPYGPQTTRSSMPPSTFGASSPPEGSTGYTSSVPPARTSMEPLASDQKFPIVEARRV
ncbi:hypothetical protein HK105_205181 [Polyrhizophydium stewartii]|uniref:Uncharacterized protein n=1 Tax=Polyrhizophydium stewartii TaxID=2732419 RepID=A0ABR4N772_9FUNG